MRPERSTAWRVIYIARGEPQARQIVDLLTQAGFMADCDRPLGNDARQADIEIRALVSEAREARDFLNERGF